MKHSLKFFKFLSNISKKNNPSQRCTIARAVHWCIVEIEIFHRLKYSIFNFSNSKKDDDWELKAVAALEQRNQKVISAVATYKKNVANTIKTGLREENVDKRRVRSY